MKTPEQEKRDLIAELRENQMWGLIHHHAKKDPVLQEQLDKIVVYYKLKYEQRRR
jgi:hypothetical protein